MNRWMGRSLPYTIFPRGALACISSFKPRLRKDANSSASGALGAATSAPVVQVPTEPRAHTVICGWLPWPWLPDVPRLFSTRLIFPSTLSTRKQCGRMQDHAVTCCRTCKNAVPHTVIGGLRGNAGPRNWRCEPAPLSRKAGSEIANCVS